ncbi:MAG: hypothetical protein MK165_21650, partial [Pirellulaceae bacterium]|nr:hypothetical protein [Pirellulaceae bacterium]
MELKMAISGSVDDGMANELDLARPLQNGRLPGLRKMFAPLASLRLTVVLLAMSTFLVFAGTLAQTEKDIWEVIRDYFRVSAWPTLGFAWIEFKVFFPPSFFPNTTPPGGGFYFPGGWLIGVVMGLNLLVAHLLRFKVQAKGSRLRWGLLVVAGG